MIIVLVGASGSGKSTIENELASKHGFEKIISYTTRKQRVGEVNGKDYHFIDNEMFNEALEKGLFAEYEEYSQNRFYGTSRAAYDTGKNKVVVLTPNGFRQIKHNCLDSDIVKVLVDANLGTRMKRYIDRCGVDKFNFDDKNEIAARVERDFGLLLGIENEVDLIVHNDEGVNISDLAKEIVDFVKKNY